MMTAFCFGFLDVYDYRSLYYVLVVYSAVTFLVQLASCGACNILVKQGSSFDVRYLFRVCNISSTRAGVKK